MRIRSYIHRIALSQPRDTSTDKFCHRNEGYKNERNIAPLFEPRQITGVVKVSWMFPRHFPAHCNGLWSGLSYCFIRE